MGDVEFGDLLMNNYGYCRKIVWNFFRDNDVVDDVIQDAFLAACRNKDKFDHETFHSIRPWLKSIVVSSCHHHARFWSWEMRDKRKSVPMPDFDMPNHNEISVTRVVCSRDELREVVEIANEFPHWQWRIFYLRWVEDLTLHEIAEVMGISHKGLAQKIQGIRQKIKRRYKWPN